MIGMLAFFITSLCIVMGCSSLSTTPFIRALNGKAPPFVAVLTETNACDSEHHMQKTIDTLQRVLGDQNSQNVDLIVIRVNSSNSVDAQEANIFQQRVVSITNSIMQLKHKIYSQEEFHPFLVIVNDNIQAAFDGDADGVHVKEYNTESIPRIRRRSMNSQQSNSSNNFIIGTSTHDIDSAIKIWRSYEPDYFFVGTCYLTSSHPEKKSLHDLEGPMLPGKVKAALEKNIKKSSMLRARLPIIFAIGGINEMNCHEPIADGVAVIKSVMGAADPESVVSRMKAKMKIG